MTDDKKPEPVAWVHLDLWQAGGHWPDDCFSRTAETGMDALYTAPPAREWVGLTDEGRKAIFESLPDGLEGFLNKWGWLHFAKALEARLKAKNT